MFVIPPAAELRRRLPRLLPGLVACGIGLAVMVEARLGLGPWEVLHQGISRHTGIPIGMTGMIVGFFVVLGWIPLRQRLGVGTLVNVVLIGATIDVTIALSPTPTLLVARVGYFVLGLLLLGVGSGLYIGAGLGAGPRDGLMTGLAWRTGASIRRVRTLMEVSALAAGWALGGNVGAGTVVFALAIGPIVQWWLERLSLPAIVPHDTLTATAPAE